MSIDTRCALRVQVVITEYMGATEHISVRVSPELKEKIAAYAKADRRTVSQWVAMRLEEAVAERDAKSKPKKR